MSGFITEAIILVAAVSVIFGIMFCSIYNEISGDTYSRRVRELSNYQCNCTTCMNYISDEYKSIEN